MTSPLAPLSSTWTSFFGLALGLGPARAPEPQPGRHRRWCKLQGRAGPETRREGPHPPHAHTGHRAVPGQSLYIRIRKHAVCVSLSSAERASMERCVFRPACRRPGLRRESSHRTSRPASALYQLSTRTRGTGLWLCGSGVAVSDSTLTLWRSRLWDLLASRAQRRWFPMARRSGL